MVLVYIGGEFWNEHILSKQCGYGSYCLEPCCGLVCCGSNASFRDTFIGIGAIGFIKNCWYYKIRSTSKWFALQVYSIDMWAYIAFSSGQMLKESTGLHYLLPRYDVIYNSLSPGEAYMRHFTGLSMVQVMACRFTQLPTAAIAFIMQYIPIFWSFSVTDSFEYISHFSVKNYIRCTFTCSCFSKHLYI